MELLPIAECHVLYRYEALLSEWTHLLPELHRVLPVGGRLCWSSKG